MFTCYRLLQKGHLEPNRGLDIQDEQQRAVRALRLQAVDNGSGLSATLPPSQKKIKQPRKLNSRN